MLSKIIYSDSRAILEITSRCNFACKYCYCLWHEKGYPISEELTTDEWIEVLHILKKSGVKSVSLTGGEPLLKEGFWQILEESTILFGARNTSFYSNASLLSKDSLVRIKELGVTFATSLQGLSTAEEITGRKDSFKHTLKTIEMASDLGICVFCGCTATSINKNEIVYNSCLVNLENLSIKPDKQHINKYEFITKAISTYTNLTYEEIEFYE